MAPKHEWMSHAGARPGRFACPRTVAAWISPRVAMGPVESPRVEVPAMYDKHIIESDEDIECLDCGRQIPPRADICPHCENVLH